MILKPFATIKTSILENRWYLVCGFLSLIAVDLFQLMIPRIIKAVVDVLTGSVFSEMMLVRYAGLVAGAALCIAVFRFLWRYCIIGTSRRIEKSLRTRVFGHILQLSIADMLRLKTGDLMARMTNDLEAVRMCTGIGLVALFDTVVLGVTAIAFMLYISPALTLYCLAPMIFIIITTWRLSGLLHRKFSRVQQAFSGLTEKVRETIAGIAVVKAYVRESAALEAFKAVSRNYVRRNLSLVKTWGLFFPLIIFFSNLSIGVLIFQGGRLTIQNAITPGDFVAFASYLWIVTWPMMALGWVVNLLQRGSASMIRINEILAMQPEQSLLPQSTPALQIKGAIDIRNLTFSYSRDSSPALKNICMAIGQGETIGITGKTGSGKTTLCNILLRFFEPPAGTVFIDGIDVLTVPASVLRAHIGYVPQDSFLFSDTIHANIAFGRPESRHDRIRSYAAKAQVADEIMDFSDAFETVVGERGVTLSGGQRQRVAIARALLTQAQILIFDDALSALDADTVKRIQAELEDETRCRTTIIVSNRIEAIQHADKIFVFDGGMVAESGDHARLMEREGLYKKLYLTQQLEKQSW